MRFIDREKAGEQLAQNLMSYANTDAIILALPRGGVVLGAVVAKALNLPLELVLVRKIGHPTATEYALGAIAENEAPIYDQGEVTSMKEEWLEDAEASARQLIAKRQKAYYGNIPRPDINNKNAIIVDDGIATGLTMVAAVLAAKNRGANRVTVAVPVASLEGVIALRSITEQVIVLDNPENFLGAVGVHYDEFEQVTDEEVHALLRQSRETT